MRYFSAKSLIWTSLIAHFVTRRPFDVLVLTGTGVRSKSNSRTLAPERPSKETWIDFGMSFSFSDTCSQMSLEPSVLAKG